MNGKIEQIATVASGKQPEVRLLWEHSIPALDTLRYSLTFRTLAKDPYRF